MFSYFKKNKYISLGVITALTLIVSIFAGYKFFQVSEFAKADEALLGRILDCRLPSIPGDALSAKIEVPPIIEPNYVKISGDTLGLTKTSDGTIYTLNSPSRSLYGDGSGGPANTQIALYQQALTFNKILPADAINTPSAPGTISTITVTGGFTGRPMDIESRSFGGTTSIYIFGIKPNSGATSVTNDSDINGGVIGFLLQVDPSTGAGTLVADNLPAAGFAKYQADIAIDNSGTTYYDDRRNVNVPNNDYKQIPQTLAAGTLSAGFATFTLNTFYDIATDDAGNAFSLKGSGNPNTYTKNGIYQITNTGAVSTLNVTFPVLSDGGDLEVADADDTYNTALTGTSYIYYTSGFGVDTNAAIVRVNSDFSTTKSNTVAADVGFTSAKTGFIDKLVFDNSNQIIYYKNGSRSNNTPNGTIGKIYCPTQAQYATPPAKKTGTVTAGNPPTPGANGTVTNFGGGSSYGSDVIITESSSAVGNVATGNTVVYTITLTNQSATVARTNLNVTNYIDADLTFAGNATCTGAVTNCSYDSAARKLTWNVPTLAVSSSISFSYSATVN